MIFCNLKRILKDMDMSVLRLSEITGIARLTITNLCNNVSGGIQFDTLDKILSVIYTDIDFLFQRYNFDYHIDTDTTPIIVFTFEKQSLVYDIKVESGEHSTKVSIIFNCETPQIPLSSNKHTIKSLNLDVIQHIQKDISNHLKLNNPIFRWNH